MATNAANLRYLIDSYAVWASEQRIPLIEGDAVDLMTVATAPWPRLGGDARAAFVHLRGRGDFLALQVITLPPGGATGELRHLHDEVFVVLAGEGTAELEAAGGSMRRERLASGAVVAPLRNAPFRLANASREQELRLVAATTLPFVFNVFRNEAFVFENAHAFGAARRDMNAAPGEPGSARDASLGCVLADARTLSLVAGNGAGPAATSLDLAGSSLDVRVCELAAGACSEPAYGTPAHVFPLTGAGYSLVWEEDAAEFTRHDWRAGNVFVTPADKLCQHFNSGHEPARLLAVSLGSPHFPVLTRIGRRYGASWAASWGGSAERTAPARPVIATANVPGIGSDPYLDWTRREGIPIYEEFGVDLLTAETGPWPRLGDGCKGAFVHLKGRGDWTTVFLMELPPGGASAPQQHLFDELFYVISGTGSVVVETASGEKHAFEWGPRSLFAPPLNTRYRIFNASGREPVRLASANDLRLLMNVLHDDTFFFDNSFAFPERGGLPGFYAGEGEMTSIRPGRNLWETNFVADLGLFELRPWEARGAGSSNMQFLMGEGSMGAHASEMPVGCYKKGHRHGPGLHIFPIHGSGYTVLWYEGDRDFQRIDWRHGMLYAPPENMFHQHFNTSPQPARYIAIGFGSKRYPVVLERRIGSEGRRTDVSVKEGGSQIEYGDQDARIHALWLEELRRNGVASQMEPFFEAPAAAPAPS